MSLELDHVVWAAADLDGACAAFAEATGCEPVPGGPHVGLGTRNALVSFGTDCYLEILAPDPDQPAGPALAARLRELEAPSLFHWALRASDLSALEAELRDAGLAPTGGIETRRRLPDGSTLVWDLMGLPGRGGAWPFFIDWRDCPHPARSAPRVGALQAFEASLPVDDPASLPFGHARGVRLRRGPPALSLRFAGRRGAIEWHAAAPVGFFH
jgi:hypothetical protein